MKKELFVNKRRHLVRVCLRCNWQCFGDHFYDHFCCKFSENFFFYLPVNADKPDFVSFLVFVAAAASFTTKILSFETVGKREAILSPVPKQWISKVIPSYWSESERAKIAIHWFVNTNTDYRQKKGQKPRSPEDEVALAPLFGQRKWRKISHFLWRRKTRKFFLRIFESVQICRHFGTPFAEHEDSDCSSGVFQYWTSLMNCRKEKILHDKIF